MGKLIGGEAIHKRLETARSLLLNFEVFLSYSEEFRCVTYNKYIRNTSLKQREVKVEEKLIFININ